MRKENKPFYQFEMKEKQLQKLLDEGIVFVRTKFFNVLIERVPVIEDKTIK